MDACNERPPLTSALAPLVVALALTCGACTSVTRAPIEVSDDDVTFAGISGSFRMSADQPSYEGKTTVHMDFMAERADSESDGRVGIGEFVELGSVTLNGPRDYTLTTDLSQGEVMVRFSHLEQMVRFDGSVGMAFVETDMELRTLLQVDRDSDFSVGPKFGLRLSFEPCAWFDVYVQGSLHNTIDFEEPIEVISSEYGVRFRVKRMAFVVGMRNWQYEREYDSGSNSDIDLDFSGPAFRLSFGF